MSGVEEKPPWRQKDVLHELYHEREMTMDEVAEEVGCGYSTVSYWLRKLGVREGFPDVEVGDVGEKPWKDEELMKRLYIEEGLSGSEIAMVLDCSTGGVATWLDKHDIEKRTMSEAMMNRDGSLHKANFNTHPTRGYEYWAPGDNHVNVHRLMMVAEHGFDEVCGKHVHHKNDIPWDNRYDNLELLTMGEHSSITHRKVTGDDRRRIADLYENTDKSSYQIADEVENDICSATVREIHEEFYG